MEYVLRIDLGVLHKVVEFLYEHKYSFEQPFAKDSSLNGFDAIYYHPNMTLYINTSEKCFSYFYFTEVYHQSYFEENPRTLEHTLFIN